MGKCIITLLVEEMCVAAWKVTLLLDGYAHLVEEVMADFSQSYPCEILCRLVNQPLVLEIRGVISQ